MDLESIKDFVLTFVVQLMLQTMLLFFTVSVHVNHICIPVAP